MQMGLDQVRLGIKAVVTHIEAEPLLKGRLQDFGCVPGTAVCCRYRSPGGFVTAVEVRGTVLALRTRDLKKIRVRC